ncbi:MAG: periplasmic binding protein-like I, partial [Linnemannia gamsii]
MAVQRSSLSPGRIRMVNQPGRHFRQRSSSKTSVSFFLWLVSFLFILSQTFTYTHAQPTQQQQQYQHQQEHQQQPQPDLQMSQPLEHVQTHTSPEPNNSLLLGSCSAPKPMPTTPWASVQAIPPSSTKTVSSTSTQIIPTWPPKYLYPGIVDLGPPAPNTINFGILLPLNLPLNDRHHWRSIVIGGISAIRLAIEEINTMKILPVNISLTMRNSQHPVRNPFGGSSAMLSAAYFVTSNVSAVIGDTVSWLSEYSAAVTSAVHIPQCSFTSLSDELSSSILYNYFFRTLPAGDKYAIQLLEYVSTMGWRRIGVIYSSNSFGVSFASSIVRRASTYGIGITHWEATLLPFDYTKDFLKALVTLKGVGSYINVILCTDTEMLQALEEIYKQGMAGYPYVWISFNDITHDIRTYFSEPGRPPASAFNGLIMTDLAYNLEGHPAYDNFLKRWQSLDPDLYPGAG